MTPSKQRGEGKIGCVISLLVFISIIAVGIKVVPVMYANNNLLEFANDLAMKAGVIPVGTLDLQLRDKAKELEIPEALAKGAMVITVAGEASSGTCTVRINYRRTVDLYGVYPLVIDTQKTVTRPYMDVR